MGRKVEDSLAHKHNLHKKSVRGVTLTRNQMHKTPDGSFSYTVLF